MGNTLLNQNRFLWTTPMYMHTRMSAISESNERPAPRVRTGGFAQSCYAGHHRLSEIRR